MKTFRIVSTTIIILMATLFSAQIAAAHPLGNFTINHYAGLYLTGETIELDFVLDMAEIPAFQEITVFDTNGDGQPGPSEVAGYHAEKCLSLRPQLNLRLNGRPAGWELVWSGVEFPAGAGGLPTLRLSCEFQTPIAAAGDTVRVEFEDKVLTERLGWREIVVTGDGIELQGDLTDMAYSISRRLTAYPDDLLSSPLDQRQVSFKLVPAPGSAQRAMLPGAGQQPDQALTNRDDGFTQLITLPNLTGSTILLALGVAFIWGAAHALTPGHGKTIVAAYLVGSRGTVGHAIFLGLVTTFTHTAGVFILGFLTLFASRFILPEQLYPWLGVMSGALVVGIGLSLFRGRLANMLGRSDGHHHHDHDHHHPHEHDHHHDHGHTHIPPGADGTPVTWRSLLALGVSGGLIPCPSALVVMLSAIALQRIGFGLILIVTFSLGLAGVLTAIGLIWVQARRLFEHAPRYGGLFKHMAGGGRLIRALPAASALFITVVGLGVMLRALVQTGLLG
jgi:ABC-type nickel/cobalt efflux system permease component RcnA